MKNEKIYKRIDYAIGAIQEIFYELADKLNDSNEANRKLKCELTKLKKSKQ